MDAVTLKQLKFLKPQQLSKGPGLSNFFLIFFPDSCKVTNCGHKTQSLICWDVQAGVPVQEITEWPAGDIYSVACSGYGMMLRIPFQDHQNYNMPFSISTYDSHSSTLTSHHLIEGLVIDSIWACGGCFQFATLSVQSTTIWEVHLNTSTFTG